ncbi:restriction endonuclease subunit S [Marinobacter sp. tcs-11]|uniref:restriction endonuclease subunit S n=1 Tax=Marinobacter sp. tcs-11 TaxID=1742860 RepID=UPI00257E80C0|nr:restriction endonuclease subunit S [Marinobacter sp. tcs-11]
MLKILLPRRLLAQRIVTLRGAEGLLQNDYLRYVMQGAYIQGQLESRATGSTVKGIKQSELRKIILPIPPEHEQIKIAGHLRALDDKIQLNHQINQTLEQMAQAIFKSWFVDFEPVKAKIAALEAGGSEEDALLAAMQAISGKSEAELTRLQAEHPEQYAELRATAELFPSAMQDSELGEIPEGWGVDHLSELVQFNPRRSLKKGTLAPYLDMKNVPTSGHLAEDVVLREMNSGTKFVNGDTLLARITPCLENGKTAYVDFLDSDQVGWGSTEYIVMRSQEPYPESMSYFIARDGNFRQHAIQSMTGTSGRQRANAKALAELPWLIYPRRLTEEFDRIAAPYLKLAKSHGNQSKSLSAIRDSLLPKLLSGELDTTKVGA